MKKKFISASIVIIIFLVSITILFYLKNIYSKALRCGVENCHGLDIKCGPKIPDACTMEYQIGDRCREYARCVIKNGKCQLEETNAFKECKICVQNCIETHKEDSTQQFECESSCGGSFSKN